MPRTIAVVGFALAFGLLAGYVVFGGAPLHLTGAARAAATLVAGLATGLAAVVALRR